MQTFPPFWTVRSQSVRTTSENCGACSGGYESVVERSNPVQRVSASSLFDGTAVSLFDGSGSGSGARLGMAGMGIGNHGEVA